MEKFVVSARKYRPVTFDTVIGQPAITNTLKNAIRSNHLAQAFLFTGPRGVGKTTTARILAKTINCENVSQAIEACDECSCCKAFNEGNSLNIYELDAASNNSVDDIRALVDQVRYAPQLGRYKVYIIDEVHMLSQAAFNAFLKTLEEPPSYAVFILATTEKHKIIPTILSRCQIFDFNRIGIEDIAGHLKSIALQEHVDAEEDALHIIAQKADGALRDALSLFDQLVSFAGKKLTYKDVIENLNILDFEYYFRITEDLLAANIPSVLIAFNEILNNGFDAHHFINGLASHVRDLLVCKDEATLVLLEVSPNVREKYKLQSRNCQSGWLLELLDITNRTDVEYKSARNQRLHVELALLKMCTLTKPASPGMEPIKKKAEIVTAGSPVSPATLISSSVVSQGTVQIPLPSPIQSSLQASPEVKSQLPVEVSAKEKQTGPVYKKSISISNKLYSESEKKTESIAAESLPDLSAEFTLEDFLTAWNELADKLEKQGRMALHTAMIKRQPVLKNNFEIHCTLDSASLEKDLNEIKTDLLAHLRKKLSNYKLQLFTQVDLRDSSSQVPYTPSEKFKKLAEKNPLMNELKKKFGLEIDY